MAKELKVIYLGGLGEIGKNMTAIEYGKDIIIIDAGMSFPNSEEMPGIDYVIPDYQYLVQNKDKVRAILVTHGHEDHIGAIPILLKDLNVPIYGSSLTLAILQHKLTENRIKNAELNKVTSEDIISIGCFRIEFIRVTHSIAGAFALGIHTPKGIIFHTGDFKIDHTPIDKQPIELSRIAELGNKGVLLMMQDSTNVERSGFSMSEKNVGLSLDNLFNLNRQKRLIVATFASNVHRVQQIIDCALKYNRKIAFSGRSMINISEIAKSVNELRFPSDQIVDIDKIDQVPYDRLCIITTGTQGEAESALTRMSNSEFKKVIITDKDTVIMSSSPIPGNEKMIYGVINKLCKMGADVIYQSLSEVHVSGHACKEELKMMISLVKPRFFIPVHGEYRHLKQHQDLAVAMGIPLPRTLIPELGNVISVDKKGLRKMDNIHFGNILLDGSVVSENSEMVLRDRKHLAEDGFVISIINFTPKEELPTVIIITRGLNIPENITEELKDAVITKLKSTDFAEDDTAETKATVRRIMAKIILRKFNKKPMILPIIIES